MFNLKDDKLELFKRFVIGEGFYSGNLEDENFLVEEYSSDSVKLKLDVNNSFGFLDTDEEYEYISSRRRNLENICIEDKSSCVKKIKSKLIDEIYLKKHKTSLLLTFRVRVYSRDIDLSNGKRKQCKFFIKKEYLPEYVTLEYDVNKVGSNNRLDNLSLKSVDSILRLNFFSQLDNLDSRISLYIYIEFLSLLQKNRVGYLDMANILDSRIIKSSFDIKGIFSKIFDNKILYDDFKDELVCVSNEQMLLMPLMTIYDVDLFIRRRGYYIPENSSHVDEFEKLTHLSEKEILIHYGLYDYKAYRVLVRKSLENIYFIKYLENLEFKYKEIVNIISNLDNGMIVENVFNMFVVKKYLALHSNKDVIKKLFYYKGCLKEVKDVNNMISKIISKPVNLLKACGIAEERINFKNIDKYFNFNLNIKNLEMEVVKVYNLLDSTNYNLSYNEKDNCDSEFFKYNLPNLDYNYSEYLLYEKDSYSLWLPLNTSIVRKVGNDLSICVGSYVERIQNQEVVVLFMKKDDRCIGCIELDCKYETLVQAKIRYNKRFNQAEQEFIYSFCKENDIEVSTNDMMDEYNTISNYKKSLAI